MQGILPDANDWQKKLPDGRVLAIGLHDYGAGFNLSCVLQSDAANGADGTNDFIIIHQVMDVQNLANDVSADVYFSKFVDESNVKLAAYNVKEQIPSNVWERFRWHFRWSLSFDAATGKIVFKKP